MTGEGEFLAAAEECASASWLGSASVYEWIRIHVEAHTYRKSKL